ncbi:hypothetical protein FBR01_00140 [Anaerolineae bacterium CFX8]|nr:hypothetical protein [Anaerolineae bacterium CFX8]
MSEAKQSPPPERKQQPDTPVCPYCQRHFRTLDDLTFHIVTRHTQTGKSPGLAQSGSGTKS